MHARLRPALAVLVAVSLVLAGCGDDDPSEAARDVTLALDFAPNAVQAPVFTAARRGYDA
ncbi:MAG: myristoyl transferase, partial [Solirubrobacterales bacterium]|nr:myristoyl transferase [Solirubrobacterales bacterium]